MANGKASDIQFRYQRPANAIYRVGPSSSKMLYTSIQAAINAAVADGFTDNSNPAIIEIYPGTYTEDLTLNSGVHLKGVGSNVRDTSEVVIIGTLTYTPGAGNFTTNILNLYCLTVSPAAGNKAFVFTGNNQARVNIRNCFFNSNSAGAGVTGLVTVSNVGAGSTCRLTDTTVQSSNVLDGELVQCSAATTEFYGGQGGLSNNSGGTNTTGVNISGTAVVNIRIQGFVSGAFTQIFLVSSATAVLQCDRTSIQNTLNGGHIVNFTTAGSARLQGCGLFTANLAGKIATGAAGTLLIQGCRFNGNIASPNAQIDPTITSVSVTAGQAESDQAYKEFQVGRGVGFQTIQAAINAAAASAAGNRKVVKIPPGFYTENLTLAPNVDLVADTLNGLSPVGQNTVTISGQHTFNTTAGSDVVQFRNIIFVSTSAGSIFSFTGNGGGGMKFFRCYLNKNFNGAASLIAVSNTNSPTVVLEQCAFNFRAASGAAFDFTGATPGFAQLTIMGQIAPTASYAESLFVGPFTPGTPTPLALIKSDNTTGMIGLIRGIRLQIESTEVLSLRSGSDSVTIEHCSISQIVIEGAFAKLYNGGFNVFIEECEIEQQTGPQPNGLPCLARDNGTQARGTITFASNPADGDTVTINGAVFTARTVPTQEGDFAIGATNSDTATNLRDAINNSGNYGDSNSSGVLALIYAKAAANVVTVLAFGDAAGNAYTLASSVPLVMVLSGATLGGGIDGNGGNVNFGINSFAAQRGAGPLGTGGCVVALPVSANQYADSTLNQPTRDEIVVQNEGVDVKGPFTPAGAAWVNFVGDGVNPAQDLSNTRKVNVEVYGAAQVSEFIVGPNKGQYSTIQAAINAADAFVYGGRKTVLVNPGSYAENLTLKGGVDVVARSFNDVGYNGGPVIIDGIHSFAPAGGSNSVLFRDIFFIVPAGSIEIAAGVGPGFMEFHNCSLSKQVNEAAPMFLCSNAGTGSMFIFNHSTVAHVTDTGATFDLAAGSNLRWIGGTSDPNNWDISLSPATLTNSDANLVKSRTGCRTFISRAQVAANCNQAFSMDASDFAQLEFSLFNQFADDGETVSFIGLNAQFQLLHVDFNLNAGNGNSNLIARNGTRASGSVTVASNPVGGLRATGGFIVNAASTPGDTVTVDGVVLTAVVGAPVGPQYQIDASTTNQAANIAAAIVANVPAVSATNSTNIVNGISRAVGTAGNSIGLVSSNPAAVFAPSATMNGGTDGDTVTINGVVFTASNDPAYQPNNEFQVGGTTTITATNLAAAVNACNTVGVFQTISARSSTDVVTLRARKSGTAGNAYTLASSVPLVMVISGATFSGGTNGTNAVFVYSQVGFEQLRDIESSVIVVALPTTVVSV